MVLSKLRIGAIINTSSGGCDSSSELEMLDILKGAGVTRFKAWCGEADQMERCFAEAASEKVEVLVVLGGDGTIRTAAEACNQHGTYLIPLPGGTMNMLPRALYGDVSWQRALRQTLDDPAIKVLSGGRAAESLFFVAAIVGAAALWVETRESIRDRNFVDAIEKGALAFQTMFDTKIRYSISPENKGEAEVVAVICPLVSEQMLESEQALEAAVIDVNSASELVRLATVAAFGEWRDAEGVTLSKTKQITMQSSKDIPLFLDGERIHLGNEAEINFVARATQVIVPAATIN
jgi:diacylglycerol kinase family enzyme